MLKSFPILKRNGAHLVEKRTFAKNKIKIKIKSPLKV
jgi:hypothetical protein